MDPYFKKALVFTDAHFGRSGGSPVANQDNLDFLAWAIDRAKSWGAETCLFLGDLFDNRHHIGLHTMDAALTGLEQLDAAFARTVLLPGNHDLYHRDNRAISSVAFAKHLPNISVVMDPQTTGGVSFLPWLVGDEHQQVRVHASRYVFAHLEMPGFQMNAKVVMPDSPHAVKADQFGQQERVFTGHFHMRQSIGNVTYIGNVMPFDFSDAGDAARGAMFLEWGKDPFFEAWPEQPLFKALRLSEIIDNPDRHLRPKMTVRATVDLPLVQEEAQDIRDALVEGYGVRRIALVHPVAEVGGQSFGAADTACQTVDQIVEEGLRSVESVGLSQERLIELYRALVSL